MLLGSARAAIHTEVVEYKDGDTYLEKYLAYDESLRGPRPELLVVHLVDPKRIAAIGYCFDGGVAPELARSDSGTGGGRLRGGRTVRHVVGRRTYLRLLGGQSSIVPETVTRSLVSTQGTGGGKAG